MNTEKMSEIQRKNEGNKFALSLSKERFSGEVQPENLEGSVMSCTQ